MKATICSVLGGIVLASSAVARSAAAANTLAVVLAHADDESVVGPVLARYAREGVQVYLIIATDGARGFGPDRSSSGQAVDSKDLAVVRANEARCAARKLGARPPILLEFPDGKLGDYSEDKGLLYR